MSVISKTPKNDEAISEALPLGRTPLLWFPIIAFSQHESYRQNSVVQLTFQGWRAVLARCAAEDVFGHGLFNHATIIVERAALADRVPGTDFLELGHDLDELVHEHLH